MPRISVGLGISSSSKLPAVPAGISVASTNTIAIPGYGTFVKRTGGQLVTGDGLSIDDNGGVAYTNLGTNPNAYVLFGPPPTRMGDMGPNQFSTWTLYSVGPYEGGDANSWGNGTLIASSLSNDINRIPTTGWSPTITITTLPNGIPTATANSITLRSGDVTFGINGDEYPKQDIGYFGDNGDWKLVWSGTRWEIVGDNSYVAYYSLASNQTTNFFPDQGSWLNLFNSTTVTLVFVVSFHGDSSGISAASTGTVIMAGSGPTYVPFFGSGNADGSYTKESGTFYRLDTFRGILYEPSYGAWTGYWDNGDNSYNWVVAPYSSASIIPFNWGNGLTITAA